VPRKANYRLGFSSLEEEFEFDTLPIEAPYSSKAR